MPATSQKQRAWAFAVKGEKWARKHHFDTKGKLPKRSSRKRDQMIAQFQRKNSGRPQR